MNTVVDAINAVFENLGVAVRVTAETVGEYAPILIDRVANYEIATSIMWIVVGVLIGFIPATLFIVFGVRNINRGETDQSFWQFAFGFTFLILGTIILFCQVNDIITATILPEKTTIDLIMSMFNTHN